MLTHIFNEVRLRGAQRTAIEARDGADQAPPHQYVLAPIVEQLSKPDYCAATMNVEEQTHLAGMIAGMAMQMDRLEAEKQELVTQMQATSMRNVELQEALEAHQQAAYEDVQERIQRRVIAISVTSMVLSVVGIVANLIW